MRVAMSWGAFSNSILIQRRLDRRVGTYNTTHHNHTSRAQDSISPAPILGQRGVLFMSVCCLTWCEGSCVVSVVRSLA